VTPCTVLKALDAEYDTDPRSPLHHDQRCTECLLTEHARAKAA
jgi:hypothetical protein